MQGEEWFSSQSKHNTNLMHTFIKLDVWNSIALRTNPFLENNRSVLKIVYLYTQFKLKLENSLLYLLGCSTVKLSHRSLERFYCERLNGSQLIRLHLSKRTICKKKDAPRMVF